MNSDLLRRDSKRNLVAELKAEQKFSKENISPDELPFDLTAELGEIIAAELKSPGPI